MGVTACVPPVPDRVYELLSLPVIVTVTAFVAVTVNVAEAPAVIEVGLAAIETAGPATVV